MSGKTSRSSTENGSVKKRSSTCKKCAFSGPFCSKKPGHDQKKTRAFFKKDIWGDEQKTQDKKAGDDQKKARRFMWQKEG